MPLPCQHIIAAFLLAPPTAVAAVHDRLCSRSSCTSVGTSRLVLPPTPSSIFTSSHAHLVRRACARLLLSRRCRRPTPPLSTLIQDEHIISAHSRTRRAQSCVVWSCLVWSRCRHRLPAPLPTLVQDECRPVLPSPSLPVFVPSHYCRRSLPALAQDEFGLVFFRRAQASCFLLPPPPTSARANHFCFSYFPFIIFPYYTCTRSVKQQACIQEQVLQVRYYLDSCLPFWIVLSNV